MAKTKKSARKVKTSEGATDNANEEEYDGSYELTQQWEWESEKDKWTKYSPQESAEFQDALDSGTGQVLLEAGNGAKLEVFLDRMVQKNKSTGWERRIRCCVEVGSDYYAWNYMDEKGGWCPYSAVVTLKLEGSMEDGKKEVDIVAAGRKYKVYLDKMEQRNVATGVIRKVARVQSTAVDPVTSCKVVCGNDPATSKAGTSNSSGRAGASGKRAAESDVKEEEKPAEKKAKIVSGKAANKSGGSKSSGSKSDDTIKTIVVKGKAPVDPECTAKVDSGHIYCEGNNVYDVMLNQTNVGNNNNKFYLIQLIEDDGKKQYSVWFRWGRVGFRGQMALNPCGPDLEEAKDLFCKKFADKTKNEWSARKKFKKFAGKYDMVQLDYGAKTKKKKVPTAASDVKIPDSKLDKRLQALIKLICDVKEMEDAVVEMKYDAKKAPLGRLTVAQINAGYSALKTIDALVTKGNYGQLLTEACNDFYTRIPHYFGMQRPPLIRTKDEVKKKLDLLEALGDIEIAMRILQECKSTENPIDSQYKSLKCDLQLVEKTDSIYKVISDYLQNTHAPTHNQYKMRLVDVFAVDRESERKEFTDLGNRMLLWHGSRLTNAVGILSRGLRIAPPEAPVTGYMFGKGIYFADSSSKSANYCFATRTKNVGLILLSEVSLGVCNELLAADPNADRLPKGKHSVKGLGKMGPDVKLNHILPDGMLVPLGPIKDTGVTNPAGYTLNYNEYIVYSQKQVKMRYVVQVEFDFN